jgi:hypothetical protein
LILPFLILISLFGYIHTKERASKQKAGAILSGSQNTIFILLYFWLPTLNHGGGIKWEIFVKFWWNYGY